MSHSYSQKCIRFTHTYVSAFELLRDLQVYSTHLQIHLLTSILEILTHTHILTNIKKSPTDVSEYKIYSTYSHTPKYIQLSHIHDFIYACFNLFIRLILFFSLPYSLIQSFHNSFLIII